ncbi:MAG: hypothetical protein KF850_26995 [Labilithrix sp.]|nr:hypothetical protein [Labilithrix sp.]
MPEDITVEVKKLWDRGTILGAALRGEALFPRRIRVSRPSSRDILERFDDVRAWASALESSSRIEGRAGYVLEWEEIDHRQRGRNRIPVAAVVPTEADALALVRKSEQARRFRALAEVALRTFPELTDWLAERPLVVLEHADEWERVLAVVSWFRDNPRPGIYVRQIELPGIDTKFIESRRGVLSELLDAVLPSEAVDREATGARAFDRRYGLRSKPPVIRFRALDPRCSVSGLRDVGATAVEFADLSLPISRVFLTENEINGLAFPDVHRAIVIFGLGYGLDRLGQVPWLHNVAVHYWGDIDTHGFAILDRLRAHLPAARSLMMDRETLLAHRAQWAIETKPCTGALSRLTSAELELYDDLVADRLGPKVRLEQERISFAWVKKRLREHFAGDT